jgi:hypothetical protein
MVRIDLDFQEWCENCGKNTWHQTEHRRVEGPEIHYKLRDCCLKCGRVKREIAFR